MYPVGQNVLIVDDDLGRGQAIERILREEGFAVTIATEGFAALRAAGSKQFALVIAAVELPATGIVLMPNIPMTLDATLAEVARVVAALT